MKIEHRIFYRDRLYQYLSDDTRELDALTLFVLTPRNKRFYQASKIEHVLDFKELSKYFTFPKTLIGVTGTNGKTTTANIIAHILFKHGRSVGVIGTQGVFLNFNALKPRGLTTPTILELYADLETLKYLGCEVVVMEVSSHALDQQRVFGLDFSIRILTNITSDHLDYHGDLQEYIKVKNSFLSGGGIKIINADEKNYQKHEHMANLLCDGSYKFYGFSEESIGSTPRKIHLEVLDYQPLLEGFKGSNLQDPSFHTQATLRLRDFASENCRTLSLSSPLIGKHNLYNVLAAILASQSILDSDMQSVLSCIRDFKGVEGRMQVVSWNPLVIVDFAHTHDGMENIFKSLQALDIIVVFGAGGNRDRSKRPLMGEVASSFCKKIFLTSDNPRNEDPAQIITDICSGIQDLHKVEIQEDRKKAIALALAYQKSYKGVVVILGKGDEDYQIIKGRKTKFKDAQVVGEILHNRPF